MLRKKTVFVVGAGASKELNLPLGHELALQIERDLNIRYDDFGSRLVSGDGNIAEAVKRTAQREGGNRSTPWLQACWRICAGVGHHNSIDNFIDNHAGDPLIAFCGKLGIAKAIIAAERSSLLYFDPRNGPNPKTNRANDAWLSVLFKLMQEGVHRDQVKDVFFQNATFVTFNYDRCIEHFFYHALQAAYGISDAAAAQIIKRASIHHVYGSVGQLPCQAEGNIRQVPYGSDGDVFELLESASTLKTYSEQSNDETVATFRRILQTAETIVFLGFGWIRTNMSLLKPEMPIEASTILGSTLGLSSYNLNQTKSDRGCRQADAQATTSSCRRAIPPSSCFETTLGRWRSPR